MHAMMQRNFTTSGLIVITMAVVSVFVAGVCVAFVGVFIDTVLNFMAG